MQQLSTTLGGNTKKLAQYRSWQSWQIGTLVDCLAQRMVDCLAPSLVDCIDSTGRLHRNNQPQIRTADQLELVSPRLDRVTTSPQVLAGQFIVYSMYHYVTRSYTKLVTIRSVAYHYKTNMSQAIAYQQIQQLRVEFLNLSIHSDRLVLRLILVTTR